MVDAGFLHTCVGHRGESDPDEICRQGVDLQDLIDGIRLRGYLEGNPAPIYPFPSTSCSLGGTRAYSGGVDLPGPNVARAAILEHPIVAEMLIWKDFSDASAQAVYVPDPRTDGPWVHSVCLVGYTETTWIVQNSFGPNWRDDQGFFQVALGSCGILSRCTLCPDFQGQTFSV